jgi:uncharacterized protein with GYD domain
MPKFLVRATLTAEGVKGVEKEGGMARRTAIEKMVQSVGGKLESFYFAFGETDVYVVTDLPDAVSATAVSLAVNASGIVKVNTIPLISPEEMDAATKKQVLYRAPGR